MTKRNMISRTSAVRFTIFMIYLVYLSIGFFPSAPIEGDGNAIANGAAMMVVHGIGANDFTYRYEVQTGSYVLVVWLHNITGLSTLSAFSLLSAISSLVFIVASAALVSRLTGVSFSTSGIMLLLFQEAFSGGYYSNSTVIAAAFLMVALYCAAITSRTYITIISGVLLGISAWMRFDSILVAPALVFLLHQSSWKSTLRQFALVLVLAAIVSTSAIYLSGSSYGAILEEARIHREMQFLGTVNLGIPLIGNADFKSHISIFSILSVSMLIAGMTYLITARNWYLLGTGLLGVIPFYVIYWGKISSPKYVYYLLPFFSIFIVSTISAIRQTSPQKRHFYIVVGLMLFVVQYILGFRASFTSKPYIETPFPTIVKLLTLNNPIRSIRDTSLVIGAGTYITTDDGNRLSSGILFTPITWNNAKSKLVANLADFTHYTAELPNQPIYILANEWDAKQLALHFLLSEGYNCTFQKESQSERYDCAKDNRVVNLLVMPKLTDRRIDLIGSHINAPGVSRLLFFVSQPWEQYLLEQYLADTRFWIAKKVCSFAYELQSRP